MLSVIACFAVVAFGIWIARKSEAEKHRRTARDLHEHLRRRGLIDRDHIFEGRAARKNGLGFSDTGPIDLIHSN
jgi:hypothetical protein